MSFLSRFSATRFLGTRGAYRAYFLSSNRLLSSESNEDSSGTKKVGFASLLSSLKQTDQKPDVGDIAAQLKRDRVFSDEEFLKNSDQGVLENNKKEGRKAVMESNRKRYEELEEKVNFNAASINRPRNPAKEEVANVSKAIEDEKSEISGASEQRKEPPLNVGATFESIGAFKRADKKVESDPDINTKLKSILSQLKVDTNKQQLSNDIIGAVQGWGKKHTRYRGDMVKDYNEQFKSRSKPVPPISLTSGERFTLFDGAFEGKILLEAPEKLFLTEQEKLDALASLRTLDHRNDFESLIAIADQQWKFPIDNEVCKVEESGVGFEEHVFLGYLLDAFPQKGPVRQFMELVICGLEQNPHMSVGQKKERVSWFQDYFEKVPAEELSF